MHDVPTRGRMTAVSSAVRASWEPVLEEVDAPAFGMWMRAELEPAVSPSRPATSWRLSDEERELVVQRIRAGNALVDIAADFGISKQAVHDLKRRHVLHIVRPIRRGAVMPDAKETPSLEQMLVDARRHVLQELTREANAQTIVELANAYAALSAGRA